MTHRKKMVQEFRMSPEIVIGGAQEIDKCCSPKDDIEAEGKMIYCLMAHTQERDQKKERYDRCYAEENHFTQKESRDTKLNLPPFTSTNCAQYQSQDIDHGDVMISLRDCHFNDRPTKACQDDIRAHFVHFGQDKGAIIRCVSNIVSEHRVPILSEQKDLSSDCKEQLGVAYLQQEQARNEFNEDLDEYDLQREEQDTDGGESSSEEGDNFVDFVVLLLRGTKKKLPNLVKNAKDNQSTIYPNFSSPFHGLALIINNYNFTGTTLKRRVGTNVDVKSAQRLLQELDYKVTVKSDLTAAQMMATLREFGESDWHNYLHSAIVVVLSHGKYDAIYGVDGETVETNNLISTLDGENCASLHGKPKIFVINACRGSRTDKGTSPSPRSSTSKQHSRHPRSTQHSRQPRSRNASTSKQHSRHPRSRNTKQRADSPRIGQGAEMLMSLPITSDVFVAHSSCPKFISWRHAKLGTRFIQTFCRITGTHAKDEDLNQIMTRVNYSMSKISRGGKYQMSQFHSSLRKKFYFFPGYKQ